MEKADTLIKFLLTGGHIVQVNSSAKKAKDLLREWLDHNQNKCRVGELYDNFPWGVDLDCVVAIQVFDIDTLEQLGRQQAQASQQPARPNYGGSGGYTPHGGL